MQRRPEKEQTAKEVLLYEAPLPGGKDALPENCRIMQNHLANCSAIDAELDELLQEQKRQRQAKADLIGGFMFAVHELHLGVRRSQNDLYESTVLLQFAYSC